MKEDSAFAMERPLPQDHLDSHVNTQTAKDGPKVAILLCSFNGQKYLADQLQSFADQTHPNWQLWVSDDASQDGTLAIVESYQKRWDAGRLFLCRGPGKGVAANFLSLTCNPDIKADFYAYSDQDDVWDADKLERALAWLQTVPEAVPALYCSRTLLVDGNNMEIGVSPLFAKPLSFKNALVQNIGGGNTMVFNNAARRLLAAAGADVKLVLHDWWAYMVVSGCGGALFYDPRPTIRYRQHSQNIVGENNSAMARLARAHKLWRGRFRGWIDVNLEALTSVRHLLTEENRLTLDCFSQARQGHFPMRVLDIWRSGIRRQTLAGNIGMFVASVLNRI